MRETIFSAGIDIGTSTTQLVFSKLTMENQASSYTVPQITIVDKEIVFRSGIHMTPLKSASEIDADAVRQIIKAEYRNAGMQPSDIQTGAVIITGETARKKNANEVLQGLSDMAGDFVVATAGPDLESVLSARGAGTDKLSEEQGMTIANMDIGGGTSNLAIFEKGTLKGTACVDVGGRLIRVEDGKITYIYPKIRELAERNGILLQVGDPADRQQLSRICQLMADQLFQALHMKEADTCHEQLYTNHGSPLPSSPQIQGITFSGGVAKCMEEEESDCFRYGDVGFLLARAIKTHPLSGKIQQFKAAETIRATVVGAGNHSTEVSGSTISYAKELLPLKNLPVLRIPEAEEKEAERLGEAIRTQLPLFSEDGKPERIVISLRGDGYTGFQEIQTLSEAILEGAEPLIRSEHPLILAVECDIGKVLGQTLNLKLANRKSVICIDGVHVGGNSYLDIGEPLAGGRVVPVVIKTLVFNS